MAQRSTKIALWCSLIALVIALLGNMTVYFVGYQGRTNLHAEIDARNMQSCINRQDFSVALDALLDPLLDGAEENGLGKLTERQRRDYDNLRDIQKNTLYPAINATCKESDV